MPLRSPRPCAKPGCGVLVRAASYCPAHELVEQRSGSYAQRAGFSRTRWDELRQSFLRLNPCCAEHLRQGRRERATVVDHIVPHKGDAGLFWDWSNLQGLCHVCHNRKTAKQDGGFGNGSER